MVHSLFKDLLPRIYLILKKLTTAGSEKSAVSIRVMKIRPVT